MKKVFKALSAAIGNLLFILYTVCRRTVCRPAFVAVIAVTLTLCALFSQTAEKDDGFLYVALYCPDEEDLHPVKSDLERDGGVLSLSFVSSPEEAREAVRGGKADCAIIFREGLNKTVKDYLAGKSAKAAVCVVKDENVYAALCRERVFMSVYPVIAREVFRNDLSDLSGREVSESEAAAYYALEVKDEELIVFVDLNDEQVKNEHFAVSPVRGMLSLLILSAGMTFAILSLGEREKRRFALGTGARNAAGAVSEVLFPTVLTALLSYGAMALLGIAGGRYAFPALMLFALAAAGLSLFLEVLLSSKRAMGVALILLLSGSAALTPVFIDSGAPRAVSALFPSFFYLISLHDPLFLICTALYALAAFLAALAVVLVRRVK
ncbi:MAG: ABC transporter permease [Clostridia bacterium]|nr:ABC transporter permease [Clostridia bacterium]